MSDRPDSRISRIPEAMPISRVLRFLVGLMASLAMLPPLLRASANGRLQVAVAFAGITLFYIALHFLVSRYLTWLNPWIGAVFAAAPVLAMAISGSVSLVAAVLYVGASLMLIAVRAEPGCEVMAIPSLLVRRPTHLACLFFTPLDWVEKKVGHIFGAAPRVA